MFLLPSHLLFPGGIEFMVPGKKLCLSEYEAVSFNADKDTTSSNSEWTMMFAFVLDRSCIYFLSVMMSATS